MDIILEIKNEFNNFLDNIDIDKLETLKNIIINHKQNIFISGVGKCETIANHFCNLLKSISYKAFFMSIINASHGDIGCINENDLIIVFSKSGNTVELINFIKLIKNKNIKTLSITCNDNGILNKMTNYNIVLPLNNEIKIGINNIPNNSALVMMAFVNIMAKMVEKISINEYKINHSGGSIGNDLKKINDLMKIDYPKIILEKEMSIIDITMEMTSKKIGMVIINNKEGYIEGIISDGDIRRLLLSNKKLDTINKSNINTNFFSIEDKNMLFKNVKKLLLKYKFIPVLDNNKCIGLLYENIVKNNYIY